MLGWVSASPETLLSSFHSMVRSSVAGGHERTTSDLCLMVQCHPAANHMTTDLVTVVLRPQLRRQFIGTARIQQ